MMSSSYKLRWRKRYLVVKKAETGQKTVLCLNSDRLYDCVQHTSARAIKLDLDLDYENLLIWAEAGQAAGKTVYVSLPAALNLPQSLSARQWGIKRLLDRLVSLVLAVPLGLPALAVALLVKRTTHESLLVREWHLGERGRLFQTVHFRTRDRHGNWLPYGERMHRFKLDRLPKLLNVLRGEMSLVGACPSRLCNAAQTDRTLRYRFNALPGLTGAWQFEQVSRLDAVFLNGLDLNYLRHWSLGRDIQMLVMTLVFLATLQSEDSVAYHTLRFLPLSIPKASGLWGFSVTVINPNVTTRNGISSSNAIPLRPSSDVISYIQVRKRTRTLSPQLFETRLRTSPPSIESPFGIAYSVHIYGI